MKRTSYLIIPLQGEDIMRFENSSRQSHLTLREECTSVGSNAEPGTHHENPTIGAILRAYNYSHLVGDPALRNGRRSATVSFDELLTPEDRIFLQFGLRIAL